MTTVAEVQTKKYKVSVEYDTYAESPRDWGSQLGSMICWHRRYNLGDKHHFDNPSDFMEEFKSESYLILPLYLYDHSGITMNTTGFHCQWDSGQVGFYYVSHENIQNEYGAVNDETLEKAKNVMIAEVEEYDTYLQGEVYGYRIVERTYNADKNDMDYEVVDSCWGFYGSHDKSGIVDSIREFDEEIGNLIAQKLGVTIESVA